MHFIGLNTSYLSTTVKRGVRTIEHDEMVVKVVKKKVTALREGLNESIVDKEAMISGASAALHPIVEKLSNSAGAANQQ